MLGALLPIILGLAPQLSGLIFGPRGGEVGAKVAGTVKAIVGQDPSTADGAAAAAVAIQGNPEIAAALQQKLAEFHAQAQAEADREADAKRVDDIKMITAQMADVASARQHTIALAEGQSSLSWGSAVLSGIILIAFALMLYVILHQEIEAPSMPLANVLLGTLSALAVQVGNYWLGSSSGSAAKNTTIAAAQSALATSVPSSAVPNFLTQTATAP
jgi:hypothetical protein